MKRCRNHSVVLAWTENRPAINHKKTLRTDGSKLYSYDLQIGDTSDQGQKLIKEYTANGRYGYRSQTTSCHVGLTRHHDGVHRV